MRKRGLLAFSLFLSFLISAQTGYNIRISLKNCPDSTVYLARYYWDQLPVVDSCKNIRNGNVLFKGAASLERGVYFIANQKKDKFYFQFIVEENQKLSFSADVNDVVNTQK